MTRWLETDSLSNQDISSALAIGAYTADADRLILVQFFADQVAGNGDYTFYLTLRINGAGSTYRMIPITTAAAASGVTSIGGQSIMIAVRSGDVLTLYLDGLAGDTTTPDTTVRWFELAALRPTTADRTLDVTATGEAGIDWANIGSPTTTVNLSGTTVKTATDLETDTTDIQARIPAALVSGRIDASVGAVATGAITAAAIAADAIGASELAADAVAEIAAAISGATGSGAISYTVTVNDESAQPLDGVEVWITSDSAGTTVVAGTLNTNAAGQVTFMLDAGTYYLWRQLSRYNFTNPLTITVA